MRLSGLRSPPLMNIRKRTCEILTAAVYHLGVFLLLASGACAQVEWSWHVSGSSEPLNDVIWDGDKFLVVGEAGTILSSPDAVTWSGQASGSNQSLRSIIREGGDIVAVGQGGIILTSTDGVSWSTRVSDVATFISGIAYGMGRFVAVGGSGTILTSPDGVDWSPANSGTTRFLQAVAFSDGKFVAVGASGTVRISTDGLNWSGSSTGRSEFLTAVHYFDGTWLVGGQSGIMLSSQDTQSWQSQLIEPYEWIRAFASNGERILAVGDAGIMFISFDGEAWQTLSSGTTAALGGAGFADGQFIVVGELASINPEEPVSALIATSPIAPAIAWESTKLTVSEDAGELVVRLLRSAPSDTEVQIELRVVSGSAQLGDDFGSPNPVVVFAAGIASSTATIPIFNNLEPEFPEAFKVELSLSSSSSAMIIVPPAVLQVTITDAQDSDADGLLDAWEIEHFEDIGSHSAEADPDGDHNNNAREFDDGTDPADPDSARYRLDITVADGLGMVESSPAATSYHARESVSLAALPEAGNIFVGWGGDVAGGLPAIDLVMDRDKAVMASFSLPFDEVLDTVGQSVDWLSSDSGGETRWIGMEGDGQDFVDAAIVSGGEPGDSAILEISVWGPAEIIYYWKLEPVTGASLTLSANGSTLAVNSGQTGSAWRWNKVSIPAGGPQVVRWKYQAGSNADSDNGLAGVDRVYIDRSYYVWTSTFFTPEQLLDPLISGESADPDGEGIPNIIEFLIDTDPVRASWTLWNAPSVSLRSIDGVSTPEVRYQRVTHRRPDLEIEVFRSDDLAPGSWFKLDGEELLGSDGFVNTIRVLDQAGATVGRRYYRLQIAE